MSLYLECIGRRWIRARILPPMLAMSFDPEYPTNKEGAPYLSWLPTHRLVTPGLTTTQEPYPHNADNFRKRNRRRNSTENWLGVWEEP